MADTIKRCIACTQSVSGRRRWRDAAGQYYCDACWQSLHAAPPGHDDVGDAPAADGDMSLSDHEWRCLRRGAAGLVVVVLAIAGVTTAVGWANDAKRKSAFASAERSVTQQLDKARGRADDFDFIGAESAATVGLNAITGIANLDEADRSDLAARIESERSRIRFDRSQFDKNIKNGYVVHDGVLLSPAEQATLKAEERARHEQELAESNQRAKEAAADEARRQVQADRDFRQRLEADRVARAAAAQEQQKRAQQADAEAMIAAATTFMQSWVNGGDNSWRPVTTAKLTNIIDGWIGLNTLEAFAQLPPIGITQCETRTYLYDPDGGLKYKVSFFVRWSTSRGEPREKMMTLTMLREGGAWKVFSY